MRLLVITEMVNGFCVSVDLVSWGIWYYYFLWVGMGCCVFGTEQGVLRGEG